MPTVAPPNHTEFMKYRLHLNHLLCLSLTVAVVLCVFLLNGNHAFAHVLVLSPADQDLSLNSLFDHRVDPMAELVAADIIDSDVTAWDQSRKQAFGYTEDVHWFRLNLVRPAGTADEWVLELGRPFLDDLRVFISDGNKIEEHRLGDHIPVAQRPLPSRMMVLPLKLPAERVVTILIRTQTTSATALTATLSRPLAFAGRESRESLLYGTFYGIYIVVILFHLSIGGWIGDRVHLIYAVFAISQMFSYLFINGYGQILLDQNWPYLSDLVINATNFTSCSLAVWLWIEILGMKRNYPRLFRLYRAISALFLAALVVGWSRFYTDVAPWAFFLIASLSFASLGLAIDQLRRKPTHRTLWFFTPGFSVVCLALSTHVAALLGLIPLYLLPENLHQIGAIAHLSLLSAGLIYRIREINLERSSAREDAISASARADGQRSLVAMLSHEFRTPLAMIHSAAQMIRFRETAMATGSQERLERIEGTARRLSALIDVFLASDALDQGKIVLTPRQGEMSVLVERVLTQFGDQARRIEVAPFPPITLTADHDLLGVALRNCLANALNYSPPHSLVWLYLKETDGTVSICVEDEGPGIPADELEYLGTPYYRGRHGSGRSGSGLGISMIRTIIQAHGGAMAVESALGAGTKITLSLRDLNAPSPA